MFRLEFGSHRPSSTESMSGADDGSDLHRGSEHSTQDSWRSMSIPFGSPTRHVVRMVRPMPTDPISPRPATAPPEPVVPAQTMSLAVFDPITHLLMNDPVMLDDPEADQVYAAVSYDRSTILALRAAGLTHDPIQRCSLAAPLVRNLGLIDSMNCLRSQGLFAAFEFDSDGKIARQKLDAYTQAATSGDPERCHQAAMQVRPHQQMTCASQLQQQRERQAASIVEGIERGDTQGVPRAGTVGISGDINGLALSALLEEGDRVRQDRVAAMAQNIRARYAAYVRTPDPRPAPLSSCLIEAFGGSPPRVAQTLHRPRWPQVDNLPASAARVMDLLEALFVLPRGSAEAARDSLEAWRTTPDFVPVSGQLLYQLWMAQSDLQHQARLGEGGDPPSLLREASFVTNSLRDPDRDPYASLLQDDDDL